MSIFNVDGWGLPDKISVATSKEKQRRDAKKAMRKAIDKEIKERKKAEREKAKMEEDDTKEEDTQEQDVKSKDTTEKDVKPKETKSKITKSKDIKLKDTKLTEKKPTIEKKTSVKLTPLQQKMKEKLTGSRFRWINEQLYTTTSETAEKLFKEHPEMFDEYHTGFKSQVQNWPENPVNAFVEQVRFRMLKPISAPGGMPGEKDGTIAIADMGCGEAMLALKLSEYQAEREAAEKTKASRNYKKGAKLPKFVVHSFDLTKANERITVADIKNVPLEDESVNVVVFCLALMGTNFLDFIKEAIRILKPNGEIWIAEIKSRFVDDTRDFVNTLKTLGLFHKSTDESNKMFVRMEFFKPNKQYLLERDEKERIKNRKRKTFEEAEKLEEQDLEKKRIKSHEGNWLLKPCIYKRR